MEGAIMYTTTYNPYRAIYDIGAMSNGDEMGKYLSETITYDGVGYILTTRFAVTDELNEKTKIRVCQGFFGFYKNNSTGQ